MRSGAQVPAWMRAPGTWAAGAALAAGIALLAPEIMARRSHLEVRSAIALPSPLRFNKTGHSPQFCCGRSRTKAGSGGSHSQAGSGTASAGGH